MSPTGNGSIPMNTLSVARSPNLQPVDPIWTAVRDEATEAVTRDPLLAAFLYSTILNQESLEDAVIHRLAERLDASGSRRRHHPPEFQGDARRPIRNGARSSASTSRPITTAIRPATAS